MHLSILKIGQRSRPTVAGRVYSFRTMRSIHMLNENRQMTFDQLVTRFARNRAGAREVVAVLKNMEP